MNRIGGPHYGAWAMTIASILVHVSYGRAGRRSAERLLRFADLADATLNSLGIL
jgi:predicted DNA-binding WGR domain protein